MGLLSALIAELRQVAAEAKPPLVEWFLRSDGTPALGIRDPTTGRYREIDLDAMPVWRRTKTDLGRFS